MTVDRRKMLASLAGFPLAAAAPPLLQTTAAAASPDDAALVAMHRRYLDLMEASRRLSGKPVLTDEDAQAIDDTLDAATDLMRDAAEMSPTTLPGALTALSWARLEFGRHYVEEHEFGEADTLDVWTLALIDGALGVLRQAVEGDRA